MDLFIKILAFIGSIETIVLIVGFIWLFVLWSKGIFPALLRLGNGLAKRKIAIFARGDNLSSLRSLLIDSKLFNGKNIYDIANVKDIGRAECATVYLVFWPDWKDDIGEILHKKVDECALVVYAPYDQGRVPDEQMKNIDGKRHTAVTNFRGRLLNDIVTAMITTGYEKK